MVAVLRSCEYPTKPIESHSTAVEAENVGPKRSYRFVSNAEAQEMLKLYATGLSAKAVGEEVGRNPRTVTDTLRKHGVTIRSNRSIADADIRETVSLFESGLSCAEIAKQLGVSRATVYKYVSLARAKRGNQI